MSKRSLSLDSTERDGASDGAGIMDDASGDSANQSLSGAGGRFNNPPHLERMRDFLFDPHSQVELSEIEYRQYWPYVDNIWLKQRSTTSKDGQTITDYYMCRLKRPASKAKQEPKEAEDDAEEPRKVRRKKKIREGNQCGMQIRVVRFEGARVVYTISRVGSAEESHSHDLDYLDKIKRNSAIMNIARREASKGYHPTSVLASLQEESDTFLEAGGKYLSVSDVRNASQRWRWDNPDVELKCHEGYELTKGQGLRKIGQAATTSMTNVPLLVPVPVPTTATASIVALPQLPSNVLRFPEYARGFLESYLPSASTTTRDLPHVTLTYASSLDSMLSLAPGTQTILSGPESKAMTHYLRSKHDAILVGVGTVLADDPGLNCRLEGVGGYGGIGLEGQPRPVVIDPLAKWKVTPEARMMQTVTERRGRSPWIIVSPGANIDANILVMLKKYGGNYVRIAEVHPNYRIRWEVIFRTLASEGIKSIMIEGGGTVMSELLNPEYNQFVDSIIVTVAPTYLGRGGVFVSPEQKRDQSGRPKAATRLQDIRWQPMGDDVVMCGKPQAAF